nr:CMRF35-like molecule 3 [Caretta caretta]
MDSSVCLLRFSQGDEGIVDFSCLVSNSFNTVNSALPACFTYWLHSDIDMICCWAVTGPGAVRGSPGGSVAVRCRYRGGSEDDPKFWCREGGRWRCSDGLFIVETSGSEAEVRQGRVSIQDNHTELAFTVTVENLTQADAGTYHCGVGKPGRLDPRAAVELTVSPGKSRRCPPAVSGLPGLGHGRGAVEEGRVSGLADLLSNRNLPRTRSLFFSTAVPYAIQTETTPQGTKQPDVSSSTKAESSCSPTAHTIPTHTTPTRFQPIIICFLLLVLLKVLLLLCIVCVLIWMSVRYRRRPREMVPERQTSS